MDSTLGTADEASAQGTDQRSHESVDQGSDQSVDQSVDQSSDHHPEHGAASDGALPPGAEATGSDEPEPGDPGSALVLALDRIEAALGSLLAQTEQQHARAAARERVIDRLHEEVQQLRDGERRRLLRPVVTDLQRLRGDLLRQARTVPETMSRAHLAALLESFAGSVELALDRCGVAVTSPAPGTAFEPRTQRAVGTVPTGDPAADGTVAEVLEDEYTDVESGRLVTPARVRVHRFDPTPG